MSSPLLPPTLRPFPLHISLSCGCLSAPSAAAVHAPPSAPAAAASAAAAAGAAAGATAQRVSVPASLFAGASREKAIAVRAPRAARSHPSRPLALSREREAAAPLEVALESVDLLESLLARSNAGLRVTNSGTQHAFLGAASGEVNLAATIAAAGGY